MTEITFSIDKNSIYKEVARVTSYTADNITPQGGDDDTYDRIITNDEDSDLLDRFWLESIDTVVNNTKRFLVSFSEDNDIFTLKLLLSSRFDGNVKNSAQSSMSSFFTANIVAKWYAFTNRDGVKEYSASALAYLEDSMRKIYYQKKPTRPLYN